MAFCSYCGTQNREGSKFCNSCGTRLAPAASVACKICGATNSTETVFCEKCGARLGARSALAGSPLAPLDAAPSFESTLELPATPEPPLSFVAPSEQKDEKGDVPDWLASLRSITPEEESNSYLEPMESTPAEGSGGAESDKETPDWIARLRVEPPLEEEPIASGLNQPPDWVQSLRPPKPEDDRSNQAEEPGWLKQLRAATSRDSTPRPSTEAVDSNQTPPASPSTQWQELWAGEHAESASLADSENKSTESLLPELPEEQFLPEWLIATRRAQRKVEPPVTPPATPPSSDLPAWLAAVEEQRVPEGYTIKEPGPPSPTPPIEVSTPQPEIETAPIPEPTLEAPAPSPAETVEEEQEFPKRQVYPDWLSAAPSTTETRQEPSVPALPPSEPAASDNLPAWMGNLSAAPASPAPLQPVPIPVAALSPLPVSSEPVETGGPLQGLRGVLPLAAMISGPHAAAVPNAPRNGKSNAPLFDEILLEAPVTPESPPVKKRRIVWTMRPVVYLLLALAVLVPFFIPLNLASNALAIAHTPAADFYDVIQALPPHSTVLVAFDYEPSLAGEMDLQANAIVQHLVRRQINIIALSTFETGPQIADRVLTRATESVKEYRYGSEYVNLGYLPGHEAGLAQLATRLPAQDLLGHTLAVYPLTTGLKDLSQVALVIELAGTEEPLKMWMEQVQPRANVRVAASVSAAVEPKARVYQSARQIVAVLSGLMGAARYEVLTNQPGTALVSVNAQSAAQLALVFVIVLGNVVSWVSRARGKAK